MVGDRFFQAMGDKGFRSWTVGVRDYSRVSIASKTGFSCAGVTMGSYSRACRYIVWAAVGVVVVTRIWWGVRTWIRLI